MNKEYEYSFKVKNIKDFVQYCIFNKYEKQEEYLQTRTLYKNGGPIMARITENIYGNKREKILNLTTKKVLKRKRYVFEKNNVRFEIDDYSEPAMNVVAIEGLKENVDDVYNDLREIINCNKVR